MPRLLLVEDDRAVSQFVADVLAREHFSVERLFDGESAIACLRSHNFDVIILDWDLPHRSGLELAKHFRSSGGSTPILMLTGKDKIENKGQGFDAGVDDYLTKPFDHRELVMRVKALLRRPQEFKTMLVQAGDLVLDPEKFRITRNGVDINVTSSEFKLLEHFMKHQGQVFSAEALLDRVWAMDADISIEAVRHCIVRLRRKIDQGREKSLIENVYGSGYRFVAQD